MDVYRKPTHDSVECTIVRTLITDILFTGEYGVHVKFNDEHVPESPETLYIAPESGDAKKITLVGLRDRGLEVSK